MGLDNILLNTVGFERDVGNSRKNWLIHLVKEKECEEIFFNVLLLISADEKHSNDEERYLVPGRTNEDRFLTVICTVRLNLIRVISARDMNKKERNIYFGEYKK